MRFGIFSRDIYVQDGNHRFFLNTPFKQCVDFISKETDLDLDKYRKLNAPSNNGNNYNIRIEKKDKDLIESCIKKFKNHVIIESDILDSAVALGMLQGDNYDNHHKAKYNNNDDDTSQQKILQEMLQFINTSKIYHDLIKSNTVILSIPRSRGDNKKEFDLSEWLVGELSTTLKLQNITECFAFFKNDSLKQKSLDEKDNILENSTLWFNDKLFLHENKKIIIIDNMYESGKTVGYIRNYLKRLLEPEEIHSLFYSALKYTEKQFH